MDDPTERAEIYSFKPRCQIKYPERRPATAGFFGVKIVAKSGNCRARLEGAELQMSFRKYPIKVRRASQTIRKGDSWRVRVPVGKRIARRARKAINRDAIVLVRFTIGRRPWFALVNLR